MSPQNWGRTQDSDSDIPMGEAAEMPPVAVRLTAQPGDRPVLVSMEVRQGACSNEGGSADCMISQLEKMVAVVSDDEDAVATGIDDQASCATTFVLSLPLNQMTRKQANVSGVRWSRCCQHCPRKRWT